MRPFIVSKDFASVQGVFNLRNGNGPITIITDSRQCCFIALGDELEQSLSCFWRNNVIDGPITHLMPIDARLLFWTFIIVTKDKNDMLLSMDVIDEWRIQLEKLRMAIEITFDLNDALESTLNNLNHFIHEKSTLALKLPLYSRWLDNPNSVKRWNNSNVDSQLDPACFILDILQPVIGRAVIDRFCTFMSIKPPLNKAVLIKKKQLTPLSSKTIKGKKKSKLTTMSNASNGHCPLTLFFKPRPKE